MNNFSENKSKYCYKNSYPFPQFTNKCGYSPFIKNLYEIEHFLCNITNFNKAICLFKMFK